MDIGLPDGTGIDVTREIRQNPDSPNLNTYIIALTAHSDSDITKECLKAGMQEVFDKPLNKEKIEKAEELMNQRLFGLIKSTDQKTDAQNKALPIIDLLSAAQVTGGSIEVATEMLTMFMSELPTFREQITDAFKKENWEMLKHHIHKLHGGLCYSGMPRLKSATSTFEKLLNKQTGDYSKIYQALMDEMDVVSEEYNKLSHNGWKN
jgi:two-component system sensor histidine kinase BarA